MRFGALAAGRISRCGCVFHPVIRTGRKTRSVVGLPNGERGKAGGANFWRVDHG